MYLCLLHACLVFTEARRGGWLPGNWNYILVLGTSPLQVFLNTEPSLQSHYRMDQNKTTLCRSFAPNCFLGCRHLVLPDPDFLGDYTLIHIPRSLCPLFSSPDNTCGPLWQVTLLAAVFRLLLFWTLSLPFLSVFLE